MAENTDALPINPVENIDIVNDQLNHARNLASHSVPTAIQGLAVLLHAGTRDGLIPTAELQNINTAFANSVSKWREIIDGVSKVEDQYKALGISLSTEEQEMMNTGAIRLRKGFTPTPDQISFLHDISESHRLSDITKARIARDRDFISASRSSQDIAVGDAPDNTTTMQYYTNLSLALDVSSDLSRRLTLIQYLGKKAASKGITLSNFGQTETQLESLIVQANAALVDKQKPFVDRGVRVSKKNLIEWTARMDDKIIRQDNIVQYSSETPIPLHAQLCNKYAKEASTLIDEFEKDLITAYGANVQVEYSADNHTLLNLQTLQDPQILKERRHYAELLGTLDRFNENYQRDLTQANEALKKGNSADIQVEVKYGVGIKETEIKQKLAILRRNLTLKAQELTGVENASGNIMEEAENLPDEFFADIINYKANTDPNALLNFEQLGQEIASENSRNPLSASSRIHVIVDFTSREN